MTEFDNIAKPVLRRIKFNEYSDHPLQAETRKITAEALEGLRASITTFHLAQVIVVNDRTKHIINGHQRIRILKSLGDVEGPAFVYDVPEEVERAMFVTLNNRALEGQFTEGAVEVIAGIRVEMPESLYLEMKFEDATIDVEIANWEQRIDFVDNPDEDRDRDKVIPLEGGPFLIHASTGFSAAHRSGSAGPGESTLHGHDFAVVFDAVTMKPEQGLSDMEGILCESVKLALDRTVILCEDDPLAKILSGARQVVVTMRSEPTPTNILGFLEGFISAFLRDCPDPVVRIRRIAIVHDGNTYDKAVNYGPENEKTAKQRPVPASDQTKTGTPDGETGRQEGSPDDHDRK